MFIYLKYILIYLTILWIITLVSKRFNFVDKPDFRKVHTNKIINTSGVALYIYLVICISTHELVPKLEEILSFASFIVIAGFIDDRIKLTPSIKLLVISFPVIYLILNEFTLTDLGDYEFIGKISLGKFSIIFTILACGLLINSYNYVDGIDGLLISLTISSLIYSMFLIKDPSVHQFLILIIIALTINLFSNFLPQNNSYKTFMGDAGSLFIGFFASFFLIYLYKFKNIHPAYLIWICWFPIYDFLCVTIIRLIKRQSVYLPDNLHFHHFLLKYINSHFKISFIILMLNSFIMALGYFTTTHLGKLYSLILFFLLFIIYFFIRMKFENRGVEQSGSSSGS